MRPYIFNLLLSLAIFYGSCLQAADLQLDLLTGFMDFDYGEFDSNRQLLDEENGLLPGTRLALHIDGDRQHTLMGTQYYRGRVNYDGQTQQGAPFKTQTDETLYSFFIQQAFQAENTPRLTYLLGMELWFWDRDILSRNNVDGLFEKYQWQEFSIGISMDLLQHADKQLLLDYQLLQVLSPQMSIRLDNGYTTVELGQRPGYRLRLRYRQRIDEHWQWHISAFMQYLEFGKSDPLQVDNFFGQSVILVEPRSDSRHRGVNMGLNYRFQL